jgi:hypothetical protein
MAKTTDPVVKHYLTLRDVQMQRVFFSPSPATVRVSLIRPGDATGQHQNWG